MGLFAKNKSQGKVISLLNQKGGVGKTTMAFNLAYALASQGKNVLCLDMDPQGNLTLLFNKAPSEFSLFHLLINSVRELKALHRPVVLSDILQGSNGVDLIPGGQDLSGFELTVAGISAPRQMILNRFIDKQGLRETYDYIVIDSPPTLGLLVVNVLCASDGILVPFQPDQFSRSGLNHFHDVLENIEDMGIVDGPKILGYIPNLVEGRRKQVNEDFELIKQEIGEDLIFSSIPNRVQLVKSSAMKKSVFDFQSKEYNELQGQFIQMAQHIQESLS